MLAQCLPDLQRETFRSLAEDFKRQYVGLTEALTEHVHQEKLQNVCSARILEITLDWESGMVFWHFRWHWSNFTLYSSNRFIFRNLKRPFQAVARRQLEFRQLGNLLCGVSFQNGNDE